MDAEIHFRDDLFLKAGGHFNDTEFLRNAPPEKAFFLNCERKAIGVPVYLTLPVIEADFIGDNESCLENLKRAWDLVCKCGEEWNQACARLAECFKKQIGDVVGDAAGLDGDKSGSVSGEVDFRKIEQNYYRARRRYYELLLNSGVLPSDYLYRERIEGQNRNLRLLEAAHSGEIAPVTLNTIADVMPFSKEDPAFTVFLSRHSGESDPDALKNLLGESAIADLRYAKGVLVKKNIGPAELDESDDDSLKQHIVIARLEDCAKEVENFAEGSNDLAIRRDKLRTALRFVEWCMSDQYDQSKYPLYNALPRLIGVLHREYTKFIGDPESGRLIEGEDMNNMFNLGTFSVEVTKFEEE